MIRVKKVSATMCDISQVNLTFMKLCFAAGMYECMIGGHSYLLFVLTLTLRNASVRKPNVGRREVNGDSEIRSDNEQR